MIDDPAGAPIGLLVECEDKLVKTKVSNSRKIIFRSCSHDSRLKPEQMFDQA